MSMTKMEFILRMEEKTEMKASDILKMYNAFVETLTEGLIEGKSVQIDRVGSFTIRECVERIGRNPRTGEQITIPATKRIVFKASKNLKDAVNGKKKAYVDEGHGAFLRR